MRRLLWLAFALLLAAGIVGWIGYRDALADPIVRRARIGLVDWPATARPVTVALLSDIHIGNATMDETRLARIGDAVTALRPDLIVLAGDFVAGHDPAIATRIEEPLVAGLRHFRAPLGLVAVPGNHDHWTSIKVVHRALAQAGVRVLANSAAEIGPLAIGGVDDLSSGHLKLWPTVRDQAKLSGAKLLISHSPDITPWIARHNRTMPVFAGHTHCGQIVLPLIGEVYPASTYGDRYLCGLNRDGARTIVTTAGLGTSVVPVRFGAPPDVWLLTLGPASAPNPPRP